MAEDQGRKGSEQNSLNSDTSKREDSSYHHGDLRNALIRAGLDILRTEGSHRLSLREAARTAGVSQAAPYRHFKNKDALLAAIAQEGFGMLREQIRHATLTLRGNTEELLHQVAFAYLKLASEHADHFRLMFSGIGIPAGKAHPELNQAARGLFLEIVAVVQRCQRDRVMRSGNSEQLALIAWSAFHGFASLLVNQKLDFLAMPSSQAELAMRALTRNLLEGIRPG